MDGSHAESDEDSYRERSEQRRGGGASSVKPSADPDEDRQVNDGVVSHRKLLQRCRNTVQMEPRDCLWKAEVSLCAGFRVLLRVAQKPR